MDQFWQSTRNVYEQKRPLGAILPCVCVWKLSEHRYSDTWSFTTLWNKNYSSSVGKFQSSWHLNDIRMSINVYFANVLETTEVTSSVREQDEIVFSNFLNPLTEVEKDTRSKPPWWTCCANCFFLSRVCIIHLPLKILPKVFWCSGMSMTQWKRTCSPTCIFSNP